LARGILIEGAVIGLAGGALGVVAGYALSAGALTFVGGDLGAGYFASVGPRLGFSASAVGGYLMLGMVAGVAGAWLPARAMGRTPPAHGLQGGDELLSSQSPTRGFVALACFFLAAILCLLPPVDGVPVAGYGAVAFILAGALLILPGATQFAMRAFPVKRTALQRLAYARLRAAPGQSTVAGAGVVASGGRGDLPAGARARSRRRAGRVRAGTRPDELAEVSLPASSSSSSRYGAPISMRSPFVIRVGSAEGPVRSRKKPWA
jgi:putative ABC transport system permease protein